MANRDLAVSERRMGSWKITAVLLLSIPAVIVILAILLLIFCETNKAYWDRKVQALCKTDGGTTIIERVLVPPKYIDSDGNVRIKPKPTANRRPFDWEARDHDELFYTTRIDEIRKSSPRVTRFQTDVVRAQDQKTIGISVTYSRVGGDFPTGIAADSSFSCPAVTERVDVFKAVSISELR